MGGVPFFSVWGGKRQQKSRYWRGLGIKLLNLEKHKARGEELLTPHHTGIEERIQLIPEEKNWVERYLKYRILGWNAAKKTNPYTQNRKGGR